MKTRTCINCQKTISGRADKKYCDAQCRNEFNNRLAGNSNNYIRKVNRIIKNNRKILSELTPDGKTAKVSKKELRKRGFSFEYFTNTYTTKKENVYFFCYEYGYLALENDFFVVVHRKEYLEEN